MTTPTPGSRAHRAIEFICQHGPARTTQIAEQLGIAIDGVSSLLWPYCQDGTLVACRVDRPGRGPENEYRATASGPGANFRVMSDAAGRTASPVVRAGHVARPTPTAPSGLRIEAAHGRPPAPPSTHSRAGGGRRECSQ
ncbi:MAG: hypothetical protein IT530_16135 [Burkholderiales bacterium]|nr:hypothetical protein [Burkholderiales bacterium]